jgi:hypothetical protein
MISFWVPAAGSFGIELWLARRAPELIDHFDIRHYESLTADEDIVGGAHIFTGLDRLGPAGREAVAALHQAVREQFPRDPVLNHPERAARRFELLTRAYDAGINTFRARRVGDSLDGVRYPVFVREESEHGGPLSGLLRNGAELGASLRALRARAYPMANLLVIEFCDLSDGAGRFVSAAAFRVGNLIVPAHMISGNHWVLKWSHSDHDERAMREFVDYVRDQPHEAWLRKAFELAGVEYGRIDYGIRGDTLQIWEINLSPTAGPSPGQRPADYPSPIIDLLQEGRRIYNSKLAAAFVALDPERRQDRARIRLDAALVARMHVELARGRRRAGVMGFLGRVYGHPAIGWPFRKVYSWLLPLRRPG